MNCPIFGAWEDFIYKDMIPAIEQQFRVLPDPRQRALYGKSSGGYGALFHAMRHGNQWGAIACHSGDMAFDWVYRRELPGVLDTLARYGDNAAQFVEHVRGAVKLKGPEMAALMLLAMAASYDHHNTDLNTLKLPIQPHTGELDEEAWQRWLTFDPVRMIQQSTCQRQLTGLRGLFIDCGSRDEHGLHYGARQLSAALTKFGVRHHYEEFNDGHRGTDYRLDRSLPFLYRALTEDQK